MIHELKIKDSYYEAIKEGRKNFEIRLNDRGFNAGDTVQFRLYDNINRVWKKAENDVYEITYVYCGELLENNLCVFGIKAG